MFDHNSPALNQQPRPYHLSVVMMVKNEAKNLAITLPALQGWIDELIVLDSGSTDDSQTMVEQAGGQWFVSADWQGFGIQRQRAQAYATGDWILALDADEEITAKLRDSILQAIQQPPATTVYGMKRVDCIFGHKIDNPYWPLKAHWRLYPNTFHYNVNTVHESVELGDAETVALSGYALHHTAATPLFWLDKRLAYAKTWAQERHAKGKTTSIAGVLGHAVWAFFKQYLLDGRFLMGRYGFVYVLLFVQYTFNKYAILYDMTKKPKSYSPDFNPNQIRRDNLPDQLPVKKVKKHTLSAVLIIKNEQKHLAACLYNIYDIVDEIIILDSGSKDASFEIANHFQAKWFVNTDWRGFGIQRQISQNHATSDFILMIDPDEFLDEKLKNNILAVLNRDAIDLKKVYALRYLNIFCGEAVHGNAWYYDEIIRFYPSKYFYHPYEVHESLNYETAKVVALHGNVRHYTNDNLYHFLYKNVRYSHDWASEKHLKNKSSYAFMIPFRFIHSFIREYMFRGAFLGGAYGLFLSFSAAGYNLDKYIMLWEKRNKG